MSLSTGCAYQILHADFDNYQNTPIGDGFLNGPIPGAPDGDAIDNAANVEVVVDEVISGNSARIRGQLDLVPAPHATPDKYTILWTGFRSLIANTGTSTIAFLDDDGDTALMLEFDGSVGQLNILSGSGRTPPLSLGSLTHSFEISIDVGGVGDIDLSFQESDNPPKEQNNLQYLDGDFDKLTVIRFEGASNATYYMADLRAFAKTNN